MKAWGQHTKELPLKGYITLVRPCRKVTTYRFHETVQMVSGSDTISAPTESFKTVKCVYESLSKQNIT
jgi:hypothetical protein